MAACTVPQPQRIPITQENSVIAFVGEDRMVTARFRFVLPERSHLNHELAVLYDSVIEYTELLPGWLYTRGGLREEGHDLIEGWSRQKLIQARELTVTMADVKEASNQYGPYFFVVKDGPKGTCGYARQVFGIKSGEGVSATGSQRLFLQGCWNLPTGGAVEYEKFIRDAMSRVRIDPALNQSRAAKSG